MEQIDVSFGVNTFSIYFKVDHSPTTKSCSECKSKKPALDISIIATEIIDADTQVPLEKNSPFWNDITAQALNEYKHELRVAEAVSIIYGKYPDPKSEPSQEEISQVVRSIKFICTDCENIALEKEERALELLKKQDEVLYEPKHQL